MASILCSWYADMSSLYWTIFQSGLRVEDNKSGSTFCDKSDNAVLSATPNLWGNIQVVRTCVLKHNIPNPMSLVIRYLDFETLHCCFGHVSCS